MKSSLFSSVASDVSRISLHAFATVFTVTSALNRTSSALTVSTVSPTRLAEVQSNKSLYASRTVFMVSSALTIISCALTMKGNFLQGKIGKRSKQ